VVPTPTTLRSFHAANLIQCFHHACFFHFKSFIVARHKSQTTENLGKDSEPTDSKCPPPSAVAQVTALPVRTASHSSAALDSPAHEPVGKRITFRPTRYVSPFKGGIFLRPQPDVGRAMSLLRYLCVDDSPFSRLARKPPFSISSLNP
jgi:hypothetical protein